MSKRKEEDGTPLPGASRFPPLPTSKKRRETEPGKQSKHARNTPGKTSSGLVSVPEDTVADAPAAKTLVPSLRAQEAVSKSQPGKKDAKLKVPRPPSCTSKSNSMVGLTSNKASSAQPDSKLEFRPKTGVRQVLPEQRQPFPQLCPPARPETPAVPPKQPSARSKRPSRHLLAASDSETALPTPGSSHSRAPAVSRSATLDSQMEALMEACPVPSTRIVLQSKL